MGSITATTQMAPAQYVLLLLVQISSLHALDCVLEDPENGYFHCSNMFWPESDIIGCDLVCTPGYSPYPRSWTSCSPSTGWTVPPSSLTCSPSVLLLAGSAWSPLMNKVDLLTLNLTCPTYSLPDMPFWSFGHSLDYVDGHIMICGSHWSDEQACWEMNENNTWDASPNRLTSHRDTHTSAVVGSKLFLIGGEGNDGSTEVFDFTKSMEWEQGFPLLES